MSLVLVVDVLGMCGVEGSRDSSGGRVATRLRLLVVGRVRWLLERLALPYAAVYHAGKVHCHREGSSHEAQQRLRNVEVMWDLCVGAGSEGV